MAGELRDKVSVMTAVEAALTGHMVFSALHTGDSVSSIEALIEMGIEPFLLSSSLLGVLSQRLVRKVCPGCSRSFVPARQVLENLGCLNPNVRFVKGTGCRDCSGSGYKGRTAIFELLKITPAVQSSILRRSTSREIRIEAVKDGFIPLRQASLNALISGRTTVDEVLRVLLDSE
jgi:type II secretory ATPase GspE/PulE/Tfp pilus assembly ATPase PilB-like protein